MAKKHYRSEVVKLVCSWAGLKERDGSHKKIVDIYNNKMPGGKFPRGTKMQYNWSWCACTWSALAIELGYTDIMPIEISVNYLVERAKEMGIWQENDAYVPEIGDAVIYDWNDNGAGDDRAYPDHVGTVVSVNKKAGIFTVMEGNYQDMVKSRIVKINGRYIRGFICPRYDAKDKPKKPKPIEKPKAEILDKAAKKSSVVAGTYEVEKSGTTLMTGANKKVICKLPIGTKVQCYGFYNEVKGIKWLFVQAKVDGVNRTGYCSRARLIKVR